MKYFLYSLLFLPACSMKPFVKVGDASVCLVKYQEKVIACKYESMDQCREEYGKSKSMEICFPREELKLKGGK